MVKNIVLLIVACAIASGHSSDYDINNVYNVGALSPTEFLSRLTEESKIIDQENFKNEENHLKGRGFGKVPQSENYDWKTFHSWNSTKNFMFSLISQYPDIVTAQNGGFTFQSRTIFGIKISHKGGNKGIVIEAGIHGCDWITTAAATYIMSQLVDPPDEFIRTMAETFDWYIFPSINPDGYIFSRSYRAFRFWTKNISKIEKKRCKGVDLNRNWGFHWGEDPDDLIPCQDNYAGPHFFSEIETKSFSEYLMSISSGNKIRLYISLQSSGEKILFPYGYSHRLPKNIDDYRKIMEAGKVGFGVRYKTKYGGGSIYNALYPIYGSSVDWVYAARICRLVFSIQLRSPINLRNKLMKNEDQILPICQETMDGIQSMVHEADNLGYFSY